MTQRYQQAEKPSLLPLPVTPGELEQYRVRTLRRTRASTQGSHLTRRIGQSLEFREFAPYTPGDEFRHVDWMASARYGSEGDLLVRRFQAEEQFTIVISLDCRPTMWWPPTLPKLQVAFWLAEAIAWVALASEDRIFLHLLFGQGSESLIPMRGKAQRPRLRSTLNRLGDKIEDTTERLNFGVVEPVFQPATVWVIISDLYFLGQDDSGFIGEAARQLAGAIARARQGLRWVVVVDLDSWSHERALLKQGGYGDYYIDGPRTHGASRPIQINKTTLSTVNALIAESKVQFGRLARLSPQDLSIWHWPTTVDDSGRFFARKFGEDAVLSRIFERS